MIHGLVSGPKLAQLLQWEEEVMHLPQILGLLAVVIGSGLLLAESLIGPDCFLDLTGTTLALLWPACVAIIAIGVGAIGVGRQAERE